MIQPGDHLGPYEIHAPLGAGGMGQVYRARDPRFRREVAVKVLPDEFARDPESLKRFEHEARAAGALNHPNILTVHDLGTEGGTPYLVTELLEGETLRERLARGAITLAKALDWATQTARGLAAAHDKAIVHRDLKPENLFITHEGRIKILDFGLARLDRALAGSTRTTLTLTQAGVTLGTVGYMAPEQVRGERADHRSDVFAFGCVLYEMLCGHRTFPGQVAVTVMNAILAEEPRPLAELRPDVPPLVARLAHRCLEKDPDLRPQSSRDIAALLEDLGSVLHPGAPAAAPGSLTRGWRRWIPVVSALLIGMAGTALWLGRRPTPVEPPTYHRLTYRRGFVGAARFSPDGQTIVYSAGWDGGPFELFSTRVESPETRSFDFGPCNLLSISNKGEMAVLLRPPFPLNSSGSGTLARVSLAGGAPRELVEGVSEADWTPDGTRLAVVRSRSQLEFPIGTVLYRSGSLATPRFSPDGQTIAFADHVFTMEGGGYVATVGVRGGVRRLSRRYGHIDGLAWAPGGREIWFSASELGAGPAIHAVDLKGNERLVERVPGGFILQDIARDGRALVKHETPRVEFRARVPGAIRERDLSWLDWGIGSDLSADGRLFLFFESGEGAGSASKVFLRPTDGSAAVALGDGRAMALSPDGKSALCWTQTPQPRLVLLPTGAGQPDTLPGPAFEDYLYGRWLADGNRIAFTAVESGHQTRLYVQNAREGPPRAISPEGLGDPYVATYGDWVITQDSTRRMVVFPVDGGPPQPTAIVLDPGEALISVTQDGEAIYVNRWMEPDGSPAIPARVYRVDFTSATRRLVMSFAPTDPAGVSAIALPFLTPDHRGYVFHYFRVLSDLFLVSGLR